MAGSHYINGVSVHHSFRFNRHLTSGSDQEGAILSVLQQLFGISPMNQKRVINNTALLDRDKQQQTREQHNT